MVKYHSDSERGNLLPPHMLLFNINSKGSFICTIPQPLLHQLWSTGWNEKYDNNNDEESNNNENRNIHKTTED